MINFSNNAMQVLNELTVTYLHVVTYFKNTSKVLGCNSKYVKNVKKLGGTWV